MKLSFRVTLMTALMSVLGITVVVVGLCSFENAAFTVEELTRQVMTQTCARIEGHVAARLHDAAMVQELGAGWVERVRARVRRPLAAEDFGPITIRFHDILQAYPWVDALYLGLAANGDYCEVSRAPDGLLIRDSLNDGHGHTKAIDYRLENDARVRVRAYPDRPFDPRRRPWYQAAERAGDTIWTEAYVFVMDPLPAAPGVTVARPLRDPHGATYGVVAADIQLAALSDYLRELEVGYGGLAFVAEHRADGTLRLLAYPQPQRLLRPNPTTGERELVSLDALDDSRVSVLLTHPLATDAHELGLPMLAFEADGERWYGSLRPLAEGAGPDLVIGVVLSAAQLMRRIHVSNLITVLGAALGVLFGILISAFVANAVSKPLRRLDAETRRIAEFRLEAGEPVRSVVAEVDALGAAVEQMKAGLRSFERFVPADLVRSVLASGKEAVLGGEPRELTISFTDIADFTTMAESMPTDRLVELLGEYLGELSAVIASTGGTVDKYLGDGIMAFWNAPAALPDHARAACVAALRQQQRLAELREQWLAAGFPAVHIRVGVHTGEVIVGNLGSAARLNYTVIGDAANLASRLEGLGKHYGVGIVISEATFAEALDEVVARPLDWVSVKGRNEAVLVWELLGLAGETDPALIELAEQYERGLQLYRDRAWGAAMAAFEAVIEQRDDPPSKIMIARCRAYATAPPGPDWDGVYTMHEK